jgi:hypothetical protein
MHRESGSIVEREEECGRAWRDTDRIHGLGVGFYREMEEGEPAGDINGTGSGGRGRGRGVAVSLRREARGQRGGAWGRARHDRACASSSEAVVAAERARRARPCEEEGVTP